MRSRERHPRSTYSLEFSQALPESGTGGSETIESLHLRKRVNKNRQRGRIHFPGSRQATPNHRLEDLSHTAHTPPQTVHCRVGCRSRVRTGGCGGVPARRGNLAELRGISLTGEHLM